MATRKTGPPTIIDRARTWIVETWDRILDFIASIWQRRR